MESAGTTQGDDIEVLYSSKQAASGASQDVTVAACLLTHPWGPNTSPPLDCDSASWIAPAWRHD
jgi:hypothetical protein